MDPGRVRGRGRRADGQPRPARRGLRRRQGQGAAPRRGRAPTSSTRARSSPRDFVAPGDQGQRALRRRLPAVHRARPAADRQARRRVRAQARLRHDRPRLHRQGQRPGPDRGDGRDARARAEDRSRRCAAGRWAARRRSPTRASTASRSRAAPRRRRTRSTTTSGAARPRAAGSRTSTHAPEDDVFQLVTRPELAPDEPRDRRRSSSSTACPVALDGERLGLVELLERAAEIGCRHGVGIVDHIEDRIVGLKVRDIYEVPAAAILLHRPRGAREARRHDPPEPVQAATSTASGPTSSTPASGGSRCATNLDAYMDAVNERVTGTIGAEALQGLGARRHPRVARTPSTTRRWRPSRRVGRPLQPAGLARASSSCGRCSRGWRYRLKASQQD